MKLLSGHKTVGSALLIVLAVLAFTASRLMTSRETGDQMSVERRRSIKVSTVDYNERFNETKNINLESSDENSRSTLEYGRFAANFNSTGPREVTVDLRSLNVTERQVERRRHLANVCSRLTERPMTRSDWAELYVNDKQRYIYCKVEKAACTTWKRTLLMLTGKMNVRDPTQIDFFRVHSRQTENYLRPLDSYTPDEIQYRLQNYYKFMFVREPLERLVSAYRDKMLTNEEAPYRKLQQKILHRFQHGGREVKFKAFVNFVLAKSSRSTSHELDLHWRPQYRICRPCQVQYDFVGHYETLYEDADRVVSLISPPNATVRFPRSDPDNKHKRSTYVVQDMYRTVPADNVERLLRLYGQDYELFGYKRPGFLPVAKA